MDCLYGRCQIQTPIKYVNQLLDQAEYATNLMGKKVVENSFGQGNIIYEIVNRYIQDAFQRNYSRERIKKGLESDIIGYEIDPKCVEICRTRLNNLVQSYGISGVNWDLRNFDFLKDKVEQVDFIIGNPPYITYHNLNEQERIFLKGNFLSCRKGRFDYYYAFIEQSLSWLNQSGKLAYLVPYSLLTNRFAENLRKILSPSLKEIIDFRNMDVFEQVMCTPVLIYCQNNINGSDVTLLEKKRNIKRNIAKSEFIANGNLAYASEAFYNRTKSENLSIEIKVNNSIATLDNDVFIFQDTQDADGKYYFIGNFKIEKGITRVAVSPKSLNLHKNMRAIFPYKYIGNKACPFTEEELKMLYPCAYKYLVHQKDRLQNRSLQNHTNWYEYGRHQALDIVASPKLIMPNVITKNNHIHLIAADSVPYAGLCITIQSDCSENLYVISQLKKIQHALEKPEFLRFLEARGTPTSGNSIRISVRNVQEYLLR